MIEFCDAADAQSYPQLLLHPIHNIFHFYFRPLPRIPSLYLSSKLIPSALIADQPTKTAFFLSYAHPL